MSKILVDISEGVNRSYDYVVVKQQKFISSKKVEELESQNKKLIEALRFYANNVTSVWDCNGEILLEECSETARSVLKEVENETNKENL